MRATENKKVHSVHICTGECGALQKGLSQTPSVIGSQAACTPRLWNTIPGRLNGCVYVCNPFLEDEHCKLHLKRQQWLRPRLFTSGAGDDFQAVRNFGATGELHRDQTVCSTDVIANERGLRPFAPGSVCINTSPI